MTSILLTYLALSCCASLLIADRLKGRQVIADSYYGEWKERLQLDTTPEQDFACLLLENDGLRFLVDYGYENAVAMVQHRHPIMWSGFNAATFRDIC